MKPPLALFGALLVACAGPRRPPEPSSPPPSEPSLTRAAAPEPIRTEPAAPDAGPPPAVPPPACMPKELRAEGRILAARIDPKENFSFCIRKGIGSEAPTRCLELGFADKKFAGLADVWPGTSFFTIIESDITPPVSAQLADNGGTLDVCLGSDCATLRIHAPKPGAFDEVYRVLPAIAVPGTSTVLFARVHETWPKNGPSNSELFLELVDVKRKAKLKSSLVARNEWPVELVLLGKKLLLKSCPREGEGCSARVVDPKTLVASKLKIELARDEPRGADAGSFLQRTAAGEALVVDRSGSTAIFLDAGGAVAKHIELGSAAPDSEPARAGRRNAREVVVLRAAPNAGNVALIGLEDKSVTRFEVPVCP